MLCVINHHASTLFRLCPYVARNEYDNDGDADERNLMLNRNSND